MSAVSVPAEPANDEVQYIDRTQLDPKEAATLLNDALAQVNERFAQEERGYQIVYNGQPHLGTKGENAPTQIDPTFPVDLAIDHGENLEPIDMIDLVECVGYDSSHGRLTTGFMGTHALAQAIIGKVDNHKDCKEDQHILISPVSGTKYNVEQLIGHTLAIDPLNYLRLDGRLIAYYLDDMETEPKVLSASSLRTSGVMQLGPHEFNERLYLYEIGDPAPRFYFDLSKLIALAKDQFPNDQQADVADTDQYYIMRRDPGKI